MAYVLMGESWLMLGWKQEPVSTVNPTPALLKWCALSERTVSFSLNNTLLNSQQVIEEIKKEIKICIELNENENTTTQNLWDTVKAALRGRFIAFSPPGHDFSFI